MPEPKDDTNYYSDHVRMPPWEDSHPCAPVVDFATMFLLSRFSWTVPFGLFFVVAAAGDCLIGVSQIMFAKMYYRFIYSSSCTTKRNQLLLESTYAGNKSTPTP